ncbi:HdeD family acid-resistance protein [Thiolapillus brandeum]|uniref:HdeD family acid-resistance protein n=1 Tax=Thiolapillus brandeum TaxID=1076588 RepID=A0A7U6GKF8_9GAMM|nr:HdeD family acid-resistance protein [Thiolapillus brandeum]BAO45194.1 conserved hypothetical protein [Thiolapillus brandeum]
MNTNTEHADTENLLKKKLEVAQQHWGWLLTLGILFVVLGIIGLGMTVSLTLTSIIFLGAFMLVGGVFQLGYIIRDRHRMSGREIGFSILLSLLYIIAGIWVINSPAMASALTTAIVAGLLAALGVIRTMAAFDKRPAKGWGWLLISGISSLVLSILIFMDWPVSGLWVIGMFIAIEMIFHGWAYTVIALALRKH